MLVACLLAALWLAGCSKEEPPPPVDTGPEVPVPAPTLPDLIFAVKSSDLVVAAEVAEVDAETRRTGRPCNDQGVTYTVGDVLRGAPGAGRVRVAHAVCAGRPFVDYRNVRLASEYFQPGARFILLLRAAGGGSYTVADDRFGVLVDSETMRTNVRTAVSQVAGAKGAGGDPFNK